MIRYIFPLFLILFAGCVSNQQTFAFAKKSPDINITDSKTEKLSRAHLYYWDRFSKKKFKETYAMELPYQRFLKNYEWYKKFNYTNDQNYTIEQLNIRMLDKNSAIVKSKYISKDRQATFLFDDRWYFVNGNWYHLMKTSKIPLPEE